YDPSVYVVAGDFCVAQRGPDSTSDLGQAVFRRFRLARNASDCTTGASPQSSVVRKRKILNHRGHRGHGVVPVRMACVNADRNAKALAGLRIAVGVLFLIFGEYKVFGSGFTRGGGFQSWINRFLAEGAYPFMAPVLRNFVLPHATAIAFLVAYGEFAIALALALGIWVRAASVCGFIYMMTQLFSSNYPGPNAVLWQS